MKGKRLIRKLSFSLFIGGVIVGCINNKNTDKKLGGSSNNGKTYQTQNESQKNCRGDNILEVLGNGSFAVSLYKPDVRNLVVWDVFNRKIVGQLFFPMVYHAVSSNGQHILRKISYRKFQLIGFNQKAYNASETIHINSVTEPEVKFSYDGKYLLIKKTPFHSNRNNQVMLFDIERSHYISGVELREIKHFQLSRNAEFLLLGKDDGIRKSILKFDVASGRLVWQVSLPMFHRFVEMEVGEDTILIKTGFKHQVLELRTGKMLYELRKGNLLSISGQGSYAVFAKDQDKVTIVELKSGNVFFEGNAPSDLILASCQLNDEKMVLVCKHKRDYHDIVSWDVAANKLISSCIMGN